MIRKMAESHKYEVLAEYETVTLKIKETGKEVVIGDFYGDVEKVVISEDESFCVMVGEGVIVYFLKEPFYEYSTEKCANQWIEYKRDMKNLVWFIDVFINNNSEIIATDEMVEEFKVEGFYGAF